MNEPKELRIILDTDISSDADDVGAVAVLHNLAKINNFEILAMMTSSSDPWSCGTLAVLNSFFGRPDIPLGTVGEKGVRHDSSYTEEIAKFTNEQPTPEDAVKLYRRILAKQPAGSVVLASVGFLTNLKNLLRSTPDESSDLNGVELVKLKVKHLVCMGGQYPKGKEWNFHQDAASAKGVVEQWPTKIYFAGFELGEKLITGTSLKDLPATHPVERSYELHNSFMGRPSWDQVAVLFAGGKEEGHKNLFYTSESGFVKVHLDGSNSWIPDKSGNHYYLLLKQDALEVSKIISNLMY